MKTTVLRPVEIEIAAVEISVPVKYGDEDMPDDFPFRYRDMWCVTVDIDTGKIRDWPGSLEPFRLQMKVKDGGTYGLLGPDGNLVATIEQDYVPHGVIPGRYGDYIELDIQPDGTIANWPKKPSLKEFFGRREELT